MAKFMDILTIVNGKNQKKVENPNGKYPIYGSGGIMGYADDFICDKNTVVIGRKGSINKPIYVEVPFWNVDTAFGLVANKSVLESKYLYYFCENFDFEQLNTTVTIPSLTKANLQNIEIPLPSLEEQRKIAAVLDKVSDLIAKRRQQLEKLDLLVKARFVEMFGDIDKLNVNWHSEHFKDITVCFDSFRKPVKASDRKLMQGQYPYYGATGIVDYVNDYKLDGEYLLISEDGKSLEFRNKPIAFIAKGKIWVNNHAHVVQCKEKANITYLMFHINYMDISRWVTGIDQKKLNKENLDSIFIAIPPIELQNQFSDFVQQTEKTITSIKKSLIKLETLKKALMQEYFG